MTHVPRATPREPAENRLVAGLLKRVLATLEDVVIVCEARPLDEPGPRVIYVNEAFTAMTGFAPGDILGGSPRLLQGSGTDRAELDEIRAAMEAGRPTRVELVNYRRDGSPFWVELLITPIRDDSGAATHFVSVQRETTARKIAELELARRLHCSELTGLLNRAGLQHAITRELANSQHRSSPAVVVFDVAGLRDLNHTLGRSGGDEVLVAVAERLRRVGGSAAAVAQLAGGEFGLLLCDATPASIVSLCERIRRALFAPVRVSGIELSLKVSGGAARAVAASSASTLLREADIARRIARAAGAGRYVLYEPSMGRELECRLDLEQGLRRAAQNGELLLHYQPIVGLRDGEPHHVEALVRWDRPGHGRVSPADFIPVAESSGAIVPLGAWVLEQACREARRWQQQMPGLGVAVNLSPRQLADPDLLQDVLRSLDGLSAHLLTLEFTEGALVADPAAAAQQLRRLARKGIRIALDDFGTGYSSLAYLKRLPVHSLKIDKTFVDGIESDTGDRAIVRAVLALGGELGLEVVAEGVETPAQRRALLDLGCTIAQGYMFSRPRPAAELDDTRRQTRAVAASSEE
jgi:diguanylate cyclase (GGDEF)-like protein/PAS domain S-box-containing protein